MSHVSGCLKAAAAIAIAAGFTTVHAGHDDAYVVTPLVSNVAGSAPKVDGVLQNAWGIAFSPAGSPFWVSDNATGCSTLYDGEGTKVPLQVAIPLPGNVIPASACRPAYHNNPKNPAPAAPTGIVWNASSAFLVPGTTIPAAFIFATEDGTLSAWGGGLNPASHAVIAVDNSASPSVANHAVYKGLAFGVNKKGLFLFATNFRSGRIDVFGPSGGTNGQFTTATTDGGFIDERMPAGYAPFGIANIDGDLFVTYAQQDDQKHDDVAGDGRGFVDVFDTDGHLLRRFASRGTLNSPWGITRASFDFGPFSGKILVGNFGNGRINVFNNDGAFVDQLEDAHGNPLAIDGLWALTLGGGRNSNSDTLYFSAGPNEEANGLFGTITSASGRKPHASTGPSQ
ncbi:TIGR03118 family protein [Caballeronia grimmiae]|uniref:TIGR03118 family protein n=1 Tax=Caballeronia grimmiae TaxID=1071679 RepID=UPI0038B777D9